MAENNVTTGTKFTFQLENDMMAALDRLVAERKSMAFYGQAYSKRSFLIDLMLADPSYQSILKEVQAGKCETS